ncbi:MAG TPA: RHS repeat-associated core domain-containing protein [Methylophilaceae bacterium]
MDATCQGWNPAHNAPAGAGPLGSLHFFCDDGFESTNACPGNPIIKSVPDPDPCDATPHPIGFSSGNKYLMEGDFNAFGASSNLSLTRTYNSVSGIFNDILGNQWNSSFSRHVYYDKIAGSALVHRSGGRMYYFEITNNIWKTDADITDKLTMLKDASGNLTGWTYFDSVSDNLETYNQNGQLASITDRANNKTTYSYSCDYISANCPSVTPTSIAKSAGLLIQVTDPVGNSLNFIYDDANHLKSMTDPSGSVYNYTYSTDGNNNLTSVTYPDGKIKTYLYGEAAYISATPNSGVSYANALTGIIDENGKRFATYKYNNAGRAYSENLAGGVESRNLTYNIANNNPTSTVVTEPTGAQRTYNFTSVLGVVKSTGQNQPAGSGCSAAASNITYDANGNVATKTDFNGYLTKYGYDLTRNLETSRTEGLNADLSSRPETRTITTSWHASWRLPLTENVYTGATATGTPVKTTTYGYDSHGNLTSLTETDPARSRTRTTTITYTYSTTVPGLVLQKVIDGPRTDVSDVTTYVYYPDTATCTASSDYPSVTNLGCRGQLQTMTDALGHVTQYNRYNPNGQLEQMTDANSTVSSYTYYPRQWLKTATVDGKTTSFAYDNVGQLQAVTFADGASLNYTYDDAHRLTDIYDATNHHVHYTLDNSGNRIKEQYLNADGSTAKEINRSYDALNRLQTEINGLITQAGSNYGYYANGEAKTSTTPKTNTTNLTVDALGRNTQIIDPVNGSAKPTALGYDPLDRLVQLTVPNGAATSYTLDALDNTLQETSSDTGNTTATYDNAGNVLTRLDSRGITTTYTYDALNRLKTVTTPVVGTLAATTKTYTWDTATGCTHGIGHLCQISYAGITKTFDYDARGNRISETRSQAGTSFTSRFSYNNANRSTGLITPTIETISANLDTAGQVQLLSATSSSSLFTAIAQNISYNANGQVGTQTLGQSTQTQSYDASGRLYTVAGVDTTTTGGGTGGSSSSGDVPLPPWAMALMGLGLMGMVYRQSKAQARSFMSLLFGFMLSCSLLTGLITPQAAYATDLTIQYDPDGNPISKTTPSGTTNYTYDALDRLDTESGATGARNHDFDGNANRTTNGAGTTQTYTANTDRLATVNGVAVTLDAVGNITYDGTYRYVWDAYNQLAELHKADNTLLASYVYDEQGLRLSKVTTSAAPQGASTIFYFYDPQGHLIAETGGATLAQAQTPQMTYVWNGDKLTGVIVHQLSRVVYTVDLDHLGSPFQLRNLAGKVLWRWDTEAFGNTLPNEDVDADGNKLTLNLRFPGQYYDKESGLHYNWHRYYSPKLARYLSPDPIGLAGGSNQFTYANSNPLSFTDPSGQNAIAGACVIVATSVYFIYKYNKFVKCIKQCSECPNNPYHEPGEACKKPDPDGNTGPNYSCRSYCTLDAFAGPREKGAPGSNDLP